MPSYANLNAVLTTSERYILNNVMSVLMNHLQLEKGSELYNSVLYVVYINIGDFVELDKAIGLDPQCKDRSIFYPGCYRDQVIDLYRKLTIAKILQNRENGKVSGFGGPLTGGKRNRKTRRKRNTRKTNKKRK